ncbi:hypothetical protein AMECASPLE_030537 [Ameca splendens]|uniref:Uncharacterized protein n=1 Tax=Ameca splendens TaxID=208324 RepID=A0ABV0XUY9_9TELE
MRGFPAIKYDLKHFLGCCHHFLKYGKFLLHRDYLIENKALELMSSQAKHSWPLTPRELDLPAEPEAPCAWLHLSDITHHSLDEASLFPPTSSLLLSIGSGRDLKMKVYLGGSSPC